MLCPCKVLPEEEPRGLAKPGDHALLSPPAARHIHIALQALLPYFSGRERHQAAFRSNRLACRNAIMRLGEINSSIILMQPKAAVTRKGPTGRFHAGVQGTSPAPGRILVGPTAVQKPRHLTNTACPHPFSRYPFSCTQLPTKSNLEPQGPTGPKRPSWSSAHRGAHGPRPSQPPPPTVVATQDPAHPPTRGFHALPRLVRRPAVVRCRPHNPASCTRAAAHITGCASELPVTGLGAVGLGR